jgi:hypothetical protein
LVPGGITKAAWPREPSSRSTGANRRDVGAGVRLRGAESAELDVIRGTEALRDPLPHLLRRPLAEDRRDGKGGAHDRHADAGVAPEQLLVGDRQGQTGLIGPELAEGFEAVEADVGGLLNHRPGRFLTLVPLGGRGPDDALGEAVHPLADVLLILVQLQRELRAGLARRPVSTWLLEDLLDLSRSNAVAHRRAGYMNRCPL